VNFGDELLSPAESRGIPGADAGKLVPSRVRSLSRRKL
jgi:hypothetical protein